MREISEKRLSPTAPLGIICRSCHGKKKLKNNLSKAIRFKFE
jgi:hypothetical protein